MIENHLYANLAMLKLTVSPNLPSSVGNNTRIYARRVLHVPFLPHPP